MSNKNLIIVESPSKIKTLKKFLGSEYQIEASVGHIRDLPKKNLGIDLDNNFTAKYEVSDKSKQVVKNLKNVLKGMDAIYIATDPDREGEAIAWHLIDELKPKISIGIPLQHCTNIKIITRIYFIKIIHYHQNL